MPWPRPASLQPLLRRVADRSFNAISVDGDTSTNDTALLLANGASGVDPGRDGAVWKLFEEAVQLVARTLALAIVGDGEGASKLVEIHGGRGRERGSGPRVGRAIARIHAREDRDLRSRPQLGDASSPRRARPASP